MALSREQLADIESLLGAPGVDVSVLLEIRHRFPQLSLTRCDESDVDTEKPFRTYPRFSLYLVDGAAHCWQLTPDPERATGLVVVERKVRA
jgi:uncharacterized protein DUF6129